MLAHIHTAQPQPCDYAKVQAFIEDHGHRAFVTKEGLLAMSDDCYVLDTREGLAVPEDDRWCEAPAVFPIDDMGRVDSRAVRLWLGY